MTPPPDILDNGTGGGAAQNIVLTRVYEGFLQKVTPRSEFTPQRIYPAVNLPQRGFTPE